MAEEYGIVCPVEVDPAGAANTIIVPATGGNITIGETVIPIQAVGKMAPYGVTPGLNNLSGRVDFVVQGVALLDLALAATATQYTLFDVTVGTYKITGCKMTNLTLNAKMGDVFKGSFSFVGLSFSVVAATTLPTALPGYKSWVLSSTNLGTLNADSVDISVDNAVKAVHYMGVPDVTDPSNFSRNPQYLADGFQTVKFNAKLVDIPTVPTDITANALDKITPALVFVDNGVTPSINTMTIIFTGAHPSELSQDLGVEDVLRYGLNYEADKVAWAVVAT